MPPFRLHNINPVSGVYLLTGGAAKQHVRAEEIRRETPAGHLLCVWKITENTLNRACVAAPLCTYFHITDD